MYDELVKRLRNLSGTDNIVEFDEAADAIEELSVIVRAQKAAFNAYIDEIPKWISVEERLPELRQNVLVSDGKGSGEGWLDRYDWHDPNREDVVYTSPQPRNFWCIPGCEVDEDHVTHWMPLPEPPKGE